MSDIQKKIDTYLNEQSYTIEPDEKTMIDKFADSYADEIKKEIGKFVKDNKLPARIVTTLKMMLSDKVKK